MAVLWESLGSPWGVPGGSLGRPLDLSPPGGSPGRPSRISQNRVFRRGGSAEVDVECERVARNHVFSLKPRFGVESERVAIFDTFF